MNRRKYHRSNELLEQASRFDAWASTHRNIREIDAANVNYPQYCKRAKGSRVWDVDGREYIDCILGYGPVVLGHAHEGVNEAYLRQMQEGVCFSPMWSERQIELTEVLVNIIPGAESAYLMKTGSDATSAAIRLARIFTKRSKIIKWGYNGWHDWTAPRPAGVPESVLSDTIGIAYNDLESAREAFEANSGQIAAVIIMPYGLEAPRDGYFHQLRELTHQHGALFIIDDMRSGFRVALGGTQEYADVKADLSTFSKAMSNGFPISAVVGRAEVLHGLSETHMSSTFYTNPSEMAAALQTIRIMQQESTSARLWQLGMRLWEGIASLQQDYGVPFRLCGSPISPFIEFTDSDSKVRDNQKISFYTYTIEHGVLLHPNHQWYFSTAHQFTDIDIILEVFECAFRHTEKMTTAHQ